MAASSLDQIKLFPSSSHAITCLKSQNNCA
jgi:hypothetical protein